MTISSVIGIRKSRFVVSLTNGEKRHKEDICTRSLNGSMNALSGNIIDYVRFDYTCTNWQWRRAHVLFLRALMREAGVPSRFIKQVTAPRLNDGDRGVVFDTHNTSGPLILLVHTLIRDVYESPRRYWTAYGLWRKGMSALDAYNTSGWYGVSVQRNGKLKWVEIVGGYSQSINHTYYTLTPKTVGSLNKLEPYKGKGRLVDYSSNYCLEHHLKRVCPRDRNALNTLPPVSSLRKYAHLFARG